MGTTNSIVYTVQARHPNPDSADRYIQWLKNGHVLAVIAGGAQSAQIARIDGNHHSPGEPIDVLVRYVFACRADLDRYLRDSAPALRAEGLALFGPGTGVVFTRTVAEVLFEAHR